MWILELLLSFRFSLCLIGISDFCSVYDTYLNCILALLPFTPSYLLLQVGCHGYCSWAALLTSLTQILSTQCSIIRISFSSQIPTRASCGRFWCIYSGSLGSPRLDLWWHPRPFPRIGWWRHRRGPARGRTWKEVGGAVTAGFVATTAEKCTTLSLIL